MSTMRHHIRKLLLTAIAGILTLGVVFSSCRLASAYAEAPGDLSPAESLLETPLADENIDSASENTTDETLLNGNEDVSNTPEEHSPEVSDTTDTSELPQDETSTPENETATAPDTSVPEDELTDSSSEIIPFATINGIATVNTFAEFSAAVTATDVDTIVMNANITMTTSVAIPASKRSLTIDGQGLYTLEQAGAFTLTSTSTISPTYTFKNMTIFGRNYYGIAYSSAVNGAPAIVLDNVTYSGPQLIYNRYGTVSFTGTNNITIQTNGANSNVAQEVAEVHGVAIDGNLNLTSTSVGSSFFWMFGAGGQKPFLTVKNGASASFSTSVNMTARGFFWVEGTTYNVVLTVEDKASLLIDITGYNPLSTDESSRIDSIYIGKKANATFNFAGGIVLSNSLIVEEGATLILNYLNKPGTSVSAYAYPLFRFLYSGGSSPVMQLNNPQQVVFAVEPTNRPIFGFAAANQIKIQTQKFDLWSMYDDWSNDGEAHMSWGDADTEALDITLNFAVGQDTLTSSNSNSEEFNAHFNPKNARVLQMTGTPGGLIPDDSWINVRIPTTMLFGTIDSYGTGEIISPTYEIENYSEHPVEITLAEVGIIDPDTINLLSSADERSSGNDLKLDLDLDGSTTVEYLHPSTVAASSGIDLLTLAPLTKTPLSLSGTYYGEFAPDRVYRPQYSLVWSFTPTIEGGSYGTSQ